MHLRPRSLQFGILLAVIATAIPVFGLSLLHAASVRRRLQEEHQVEVSRYAERAAANIGRYLEGTYQLLVALAHFEPVRELRPGDASALMQELRATSPLFANLALVRGDGTIAASAAPVPPGIATLGDRSWFLRLQENRRLGLGEFLVSRSTGKSVINMACPLPGQSSTGPLDCVSASLDLQVLLQALNGLHLSPDTDLYLLDRNGTILGRHGSAPPLQRQTLPGWSGQPQARTVTTTDPEGQSRNFTFVPVPSVDEGLWVGAGLSKSTVSAETRGAFLRSFALTSGWASALLLLAWGVGHRLLIHPLGRLSAAASALTRCRWDARARIASGADELRALGDTFDTIAAHLNREMEQLRTDTAQTTRRQRNQSTELASTQQELRQAIAARQTADAALRQSEATSRAFIESINEAALLLDPDGKVLLANQAGAQRLGGPLPKLIGSSIFDHMPEPAATQRREVLAQIRQTRSPVTFDESDHDHSLQLQFTPVLDDAGEVAAIAVLGVDVTKHQQLEEQLRHSVSALAKALAEVRTLSGLLPICSGCKKIRDETGAWNPIEQYIGEHTGTEFSHGLCPDCLRRLYPEYEDKAVSDAPPRTTPENRPGLRRYDSDISCRTNPDTA